MVLMGNEHIMLYGTLRIWTDMEMVEMAKRVITFGHVCILVKVSVWHTLYIINYKKTIKQSSLVFFDH